MFQPLQKSMHIGPFAWIGGEKKKPYSHLGIPSSDDLPSPFKTCHRRKIPNCHIIKTFHLLPWSLRNDYLNYRRSKKYSDLWRRWLSRFAWIFGSTHDLYAKEISRNYVVKVQYKNNNESFVVWEYQFPRSNILSQPLLYL